MRRLPTAALAGLAIAAAGLTLAPAASARPGADGRPATHARPGAHARAAAHARPATHARAAAGTALAAASVRSTGTFGTTRYLSTPQSAEAVAIGKVTGNGRNDLVVTGSIGTDDYLWMYPQLADGRLGQPQKYTAHDFAPGIQLIITDLYGNGRHEILRLGLHGVLVWTPSHGRLSGPATIRLPVSNAADFTVADLNHDGHPDIILDNYQSQDVVIYYGTASHAFRRGPTLRFPAGTIYSTVLAAGFRRPGRPGDIVYSSTYGALVRLRRANGSYGPAASYPLAPIGSGGAFPSDGVAAAGDLTGDGRPDLVLANEADPDRSGIEVYADTASGRLRKPAIYHTGGVPGMMTIADLTGNGRNDLVIEHIGFNQVGVMLQRPDGRLGPETVYAATGCCYYAPSRPAVGDLNGDGRPDIAVTTVTGVAVIYQKR
jgi:FG-GAP-like repeat